MKDLYIKTKNGDMFYKKIVSPTSKGNIVFLHGWGMSHETFDSLLEYFKDYNLYIVDFLGFGLSDEANKKIKLDDYVNHIEELVKKEDLDRLILIGHSFGGRVAIRIASKRKIEKIVLVNSAGINHHNFKYHLKVLWYKIRKLFVYLFKNKDYNNFVRRNGSADYNSLSFNMRGTFKNIVNEDLKKDLKKISCDSLVIGSLFDKEVPLKDTKLMSELIKKSKFITFYRSGHFSYLDEKEKFLKEVMLFINDGNIE